MTSYPEMSARNYLSTPRNSQKECSSHLLRGGSLKSHTYILYWNEWL